MLPGSIKCPLRMYTIFMVSPEKAYHICTIQGSQTQDSKNCESQPALGTGVLGA